MSKPKAVRTADRLMGVPVAPVIVSALLFLVEKHDCECEYLSSGYCDRLIEEKGKY